MNKKDKEKLRKWIEENRGWRETSGMDFILVEDLLKFLEDN